MKTRTIKLTESEIKHIINLIIDNEREGIYYGPSKQYWARSARIKEKLGYTGTPAKNKNSNLIIDDNYSRFFNALK